MFHRDLVRVDLWKGLHKHNSSQRLAGFKLLERSCRRWQLLLLQLCLRGNLLLGMHLRFCTHVEAKYAPESKIKF
jgi:hypothetical protein